MKKWIWTFAGCLLVLAASIACAQEPGKASTGDEVVAKIGDEVITATELEAMVGPSLVSLRQQVYQAKIAGLQAQIFERLVAKAATAEGITSADYIKKNVTDKVGPPDEGEIVKVMTQYRNRLAQDDNQARQQVVQALQQQQQVALSEELRKELFAAAGVEILLDPPRVDVKITKDTPVRGPSDAPIVLVEYTDYQCPYCSRVQPTITALLERYEGQIKHVFKDLPLPIHAEAELAGQAAHCAGDQGKFWELHDWLFANQRAINIEAMSTAAGQIGMDTDLFRACIDQGTHAETVRADAMEARSFGITGTPGFLINGRVLTGAQPIEAFEKVIDEELTRRGIEIPPKPQPEEAADEVAE